MQRLEESRLRAALRQPILAYRFQIAVGPGPLNEVRIRFSAVFPRDGMVGRGLALRAMGR